jgi:hypoxanthine phosphoribosyltransferase
MRLEELISANDIKLKIRELAEEIAASIPPSDEPIILLGILKGSVHFLSDLSRTLWELGRECQLEFMQVSSWHGATSSSGVVQIKISTVASRAATSSSSKTFSILVVP